MKTPEIPANEAERLGALHSYQILDTDFEERFDGLTRLAASILEVPIALVSFIDTDRQWFKSRYGLDVLQTPREISFCGHLLTEGAALVVPDASEDVRFADNPHVAGAPHLRFYAGMPLLTPDGHVLGSLCAIDLVPRQPSPHQLEMLALLAKQVVAQLEARRERHQIALERTAARETSGRLRVLFDTMAEGVVQQSRDGVILAANRAAEGILGLTAAQMAGRASTDPRWRTIREDGTPFLGESHPSMMTLRTGDAYSNVVMGVHKPGGELTWICVNSRPLRDAADDQGKPYGVLTTFHDITGVKAAQAATERLARQEHLVTTGTLAAGIGHEINNPLTFINANIEFAIEELRSIAGGWPSGRLREIIDVLGEAREGADRVRKIVRGLRALAREEAQAIPTSVAETVDIAINIAAHEIRSRATVVKELVSTPSVLADESRLTQILVNLLANAGQAFATSDVEKNRITVKSALELPDRVSIVVSDNGPGMPAEVLNRIFDPFFTTKPVGQGTGLGLSISQGIVQALGGEIVAESSVGVGTTFRVSLPVATQPLGSAEVVRAAESTVRGRVLIVDDEPVILSAIRRALERDHEVIALDDPREALRRLEGGERFDVVFCDLTMPHLDGAELYTRVLAVDRAMAERFVFVTGGALEGRAQTFLSEVPNERIDKPFNLQNLRGIARRFVSARAAPRG